MQTLRSRGLVAALLAGLLVFTLMPIGSAAPPARAELVTEIPVEGTVPGGTFEGVLTITEFVLEEGQLLVSGVLEGTATVGGVVTEITQTFEDVVVDFFTGPGRCEIITLDLGPIFLDVLGLEVDLSEINLDVTAVRGPGNLLGNLLCAVVGLLDGGGPLAGLLRLIDRINSIL